MWRENNNKLVFEKEFQSFEQAIIFINKVATLATKHNHHPQIYNTYNKVKLQLTTHDIGNKVTVKDKKLAAEIEQLISS